MTGVRVVFSCVAITWMLLGCDSRPAGDGIDAATPPATPVERARDPLFGDLRDERRVGKLLAAGPLRPLPERLESIRAPGQVAHIEFARRAGVALVSGGGEAWVVDIGNGQAISHGKARDDGGVASVGSLSPNGRLYVAANGDGADILDAETGETLVQLPRVSLHSLQWVGEVGMLLVQKGANDDQRVVFRDLATGLESVLRVRRIGSLVPVPGKPGRFVLAGIGTKTVALALEQTPAGWIARATAMPGEVSLVVDEDDWVTADGRYLLDATGPFLDVLDVTTMQSRQIALAPFHPIVAYGRPDPDEVLMLGEYEGADKAREWLVYSLSTGTAAPAGPGPARSEGWVAHVPSLRQMVLVRGDRVSPLPIAPSQPMAAVAEVVAARPARAGTEAADALEARRVRDAFAFLEPREGEVAPAPANVEPMPGPVLELAKQARVVGVGVYSGTRQPGQAYPFEVRGGSVQVRVLRTKQPIILVLSSYDPVRWVLSVEPGAEVGAILLAGHTPGSQVLGALAPVHVIGNGWARTATHAEFPGLEAQVRRWTGKKFDSYHGDQDGDTYYLTE